MSGHTSQRCYKLHGYPPNYKNDRGPRTAANVHAEGTESTTNLDTKNLGFTEAQYSQLLQLLGKNQNDEELAGNTNPKSAFVAGKICLATLATSKWIVDSGATDHMCHDLSMFSPGSNIQKSDISVTIPNGKQVLVSQIGM